MAKAIESTKAGANQAWAIIVAALSLLLALSQWSYQWTDISALTVPPQDPPHNFIGPVGAWLAFGLFMGLGVGAYLLPLVGLYAAYMLWARPDERISRQTGWIVLLFLGLGILLDLMSAPLQSFTVALNLGSYSGGLVARFLAQDILVKLFKTGGAFLIGLLIVGLALLMLVGSRRFGLAGRGVTAAVRVVLARAQTWFAARLAALRARRAGEGSAAGGRKPEQETLFRGARPGRATTRTISGAVRDTATVAVGAGSAPADRAPGGVTATPLETATPVASSVVTPPPQAGDTPPARLTRKPPAPKPVPPVRTEGPAGPGAARTGVYELPPVDLLNAAVPPEDRPVKSDLSVTSKILEETLREFGIETQVTDANQGPVVTRYDLTPAPGVRVERITQLSNNIALALKATSIRVQAPVPGKGVVGIEVPNLRSDLVYMREVMEDGAASGKAALPLILGKDVGGKNLVEDLAAMPHLLIAGATGSGKTVCMNSILAGLLLMRKPTEMRLMLIDPKIVEFSVYNDLPHLVVPVITDAKKVAIGLRWAINEMEKRYKMFAKAGVRNIAGFNSRTVVEQPELFGGATAPKKEREEVPKTVPYIVIVIDELADLMLAAQAEIENGIARLAQLSRAVGIHMIIATQRPSVNVITGTIKANFPARIAFQVAQKVDSRTILDTIGAEKLLGRGDMLYHPPGSSKLIRAQGCLISDDEIARIIEFVKAQQEPTFEAEIAERMTSKSEVGDVDDSDEMLEQAIEVIRETQRASTSSLQRRLRIGYTRAARLMDILEQRGVVGPPKGSDPREILIDLDAGIPDIESQASSNDAAPDDAALSEEDGMEDIPGDMADEASEEVSGDRAGPR